MLHTVAYNREEDSLQIPDRETRFNCSRHAGRDAGIPSQGCETLKYHPFSLSTDVTHCPRKTRKALKKHPL